MDTPTILISLYEQYGAEGVLFLFMAAMIFIVYRVNLAQIKRYAQATETDHEARDIDNQQRGLVTTIAGQTLEMQQNFIRLQADYAQLKARVEVLEKQYETDKKAKQHAVIFLQYSHNKIVMPMLKYVNAHRKEHDRPSLSLPRQYKEHLIQTVKTLQQKDIAS